MGQFTTPRVRKGDTPVTQATVPWIVEGFSGMTPVTVTVSGTASVTQGTSPWIVSGSGSAGSAASGVITVQGIASMTPLAVTLASTTITGTVAVTQSTSPWVISGTVTTTAGSESSTQSALERGGNLERIAGILERWPTGFDQLLMLADGVQDGAFRVDLRRWLGSDAPTVGQKVMASSLPVTLASDQPPVAVSGTMILSPTTIVPTSIPVPYGDDSGRTRIAYDLPLATEDTLQGLASKVLTEDTFKQRTPEPRSWITRVCSCTASTTSMVMLTANASRLMASVFNDSTATLYLLFAPGAASSTYYSVKLIAGAYFEFTQPIYPGQMSGIWSAANGSALVTEFS